ncbi:MAG: CaiB/BaiF CoA-transferase family protein [Pseudotabrizicola sp.]|uniref:CaiB/BaiF CoA transferase family protein n=1 Tax=Pseudotabrizicola sp. TaxID=2939647 RepID=UPI002731E962|nr:CaiB/BaiF CoA-transferase family protein [Pseudotabrizicola sp.]MDP2083069.1 CaiB/BaiF CoA-transferase family protein [Pseudotabrizicola sp.]MDZ7572487.1 CaiB/BaiF CoA-transferase family protein [Pseudotabrizicola sp.]
MTADLDGILVVSLEQAVAAPLATSRLAEAGARVIKVERPEGDFARRYDTLVHGESAYFVWLNRGKESIALDLRRAEDLALLRAMAARADVFVQNLAPGAADRLGLGRDALCAAHPGLIYVSISGYGEEGPYRDQKAYDMLIQAESGLLSINGTAQGPARVGISVCDIAAGETAFAGILQSLIARERNGIGRHVEVSLFQTMADWMNVPYLQSHYGGMAPARMGVQHPSIAPYGAFVCADGRAVLLSVQSDREWVSFAAGILGRADLSQDPRFATNVARVAHRDQIDALIAPVMAALPRDQAIALLNRSGIACGRLSDLADLADHPQARRTRVATASGPVDLMDRGLRFSDARDSLPAVVPGVDEHGAALRHEFAPPP